MDFDRSRRENTIRHPAIAGFAVLPKQNPLNRKRIPIVIKRVKRLWNAGDRIRNLDLTESRHFLRH